ncbi:MAG TPA: methyltransferase domain-containing protein [Candidatus Dormibacteraeota bacterium]|jgi:SAM-dependent methyltransferase
MSWSRVYASAVLDPLAEQLAGLAGIRAGMRVVDVLAGSGRLTRRLLTSVGPSGQVTAIEDGDSAAAELRDELRAARVHADVAAASPGALPFGDRHFDAALSLVRITATRGGVAALEEMARVAPHVAVLVPRRGAVEDALIAAWTAVSGDPPAHLLATFEPPPLPVDWTSQVVSDVARFDGIGQLSQALIRQHELSLPVDAARAVERLLGDALARHAGADGTLRVPVQVTLLRSAA